METNEHQELLDAIEVVPIHYDDIPEPPTELIALIQPRVMKPGMDRAWQEVTLLEQKGLLSPDGKVFDLGCGYGRMAYPLRNYLNADGRYIGFDAYGPFISFLSKAFSVDPRFWFFHIDLRNEQYNPNGQDQFYGWAMEDNSLDTVIASSLFTHVGKETTHQYFAELQRTLKPGGFVWAQVYRTLDQSKVTDWDFRVVRQEGDWIHIFQKYGFRLVNQWSGDMRVDQFHDAWNVILQKESKQVGEQTNE